MKSKMWFGVLAVLALAAVAVVVASPRSEVSADAIASGVADATVGDADCGDCDQVRYFQLSLDGTGKVSWTATSPSKPTSHTFIDAAGKEISATVDCRTGSTNQSGRKSCSDTEVHVAPKGWCFAENTVNKRWHSDIGSSNSVSVSFSDQVEVIPGSGITQGTKMTVVGHARSGHGHGERGHTHCTVTVKLTKYER